MRNKVMVFFTVALATAVQHAQAAADDPAIASIKRQLTEQGKAIAAQKNQLASQQHLIALLEKQLMSQSGPAGAVVAQSQATGVKTAQVVGPESGPAIQRENKRQHQPNNEAVVAQADDPGASPMPAEIGQAPEEKKRPPKIEAIASVGGVLTRGGTFVVEPYGEYVHTSLNQFTFEGVQIIDAVLVGAINAGSTEQDLGLAGLTLRYGITDRLEVEARVPYVYRTQDFTGALLNSSNNVLHQGAHGSGIGDVEGALHYQVNDGGGGWPFFVGNLRFKSDTGTGPWDVSYNADGSAQTLPTGSGFNAINPSLTVIYPTDPAVLYGNIGWIHNFDDNRAITVNQSVITQIRPGDTYSGSVGIGISLNDSTSFSIGYEQDYIQATTEIVNGSQQFAHSLLAGVLAFGLTANTTNRNTINVGLNVGVTRDAPDVALTLRTPFSFDGPSL